MGGCPVYYRMFSSVSDFNPSEANSIFLSDGTITDVSWYWPLFFDITNYWYSRVRKTLKYKEQNIWNHKIVSILSRKHQISCVLSKDIFWFLWTYTLSRVCEWTRAQCLACFQGRRYKKSLLLSESCVVDFAVVFCI